MSVLSNPRWEQFASAVASGLTPSESYISLGYSAKTAQKSASRLSKVPQVKSRIEELLRLSAQSAVQAGWLNRQFVLNGLKKSFDRAMELDKLSDANTSLKMMGQELGMFTERHDVTVWDGDPTKLDDKQLDKLTQSLETIAYGQDEARIRSEKRKVLSEAGSAVVEFVVKDQEKHNQVPKMHDPEPFPLGVIDGRA